MTSPNLSAYSQRYNASYQIHQTYPLKSPPISTRLTSVNNSPQPIPMQRLQIGCRMLLLFLQTQMYGLPSRMVLNFVFLSFEF